MEQPEKQFRNSREVTVTRKEKFGATHTRVSDIARDPVLAAFRYREVALSCSATEIIKAIALSFLTKIDPKGSVSMVTTRQTGFCDKPYNHTALS